LERFRPIAKNAEIAFHEKRNLEQEIEKNYQKEIEIKSFQFSEQNDHCLTGLKV
jgi:hypothetical protein